MYFSGKKYFAKVIDSIDHAQHCIAIECYIIEHGEVLRQILLALERAVNRGVKVRVVADAFGSYGLANELFDERRIAFRIYHPFRLFQLVKFNIRNHKKVFIIDNKLAFVGSHNIFDRALEWLEAGVAIEGEDVDKICFAFEMTWSSAYERHQGPRWLMSAKSMRSRLHSHFVLFNTPWSLRRHSNMLRYKMLRHAQRSIWLASPYFIPEKRIIAHLRKAAQNGVDVRLLLPSQSDVPFTVWVAHYLLPKLLLAKVRVFEFKPCMMHAKVWSVDEDCFIGSSNLNHRSYKLDLEIDARVTYPENKLKIKEWFETCFEQSQEIHLHSIPSNWWQKILVKFLIIFREWM